MSKRLKRRYFSGLAKLFVKLTLTENTVFPSKHTVLFRMKKLLIQNSWQQSHLQG